MKLVVVGVGSIGMRHLTNLVAMGHEVHAVDVNTGNLSKAVAAGAVAHTSLDEALQARPQAALICTYSHNHIEPAMQCALAGCHLFIEKPLSMSLQGIDTLSAILKEHNLISLVGCNMRFHPAIAHIHNLLDTNSLFKQGLWASFEAGYYLPFDKQDYRNCYKARRDLGGNLIFDGIHELDYAVWFFGEPLRVFCNKGIISSLDIDTEDHVEIMIQFQSGAHCTVHMDYLQHGYSRRAKVVCEQGTVVWDFVQGTIGQVTTQQPEWSWQDFKLPLSYNQMYVDELSYFISCIETGSSTFNSVADSLSALKIALAAERSAVSGQWELII